MIGKEQEDIIIIEPGNTIHERRTLGMMKKNQIDKTHPLYPIYIQQRIERSARETVPRTRANRHRRSFSHPLIKFYNEDFNRIMT